MITNILKKVVNFGLGLVRSAKNEAKATVCSLEREGLLSKKQAEDLLKRILREASMERKEFQKFMTGEINKELKKAKGLVKAGGKKFATAIKTRHQQGRAKKRR
ncbi:hypothetical protein HZA97_00180 [Candidatus Woesearchaeota archaeon]|nr:hypothetical protein [Candidatus Woesearchaeota archaeon]